MELDDGTADAFLLAAPGTSLVIFTSEGCGACRWVRQVLPGACLPVTRLCWIDAGRNGGLVTRFGVFHLPALFLVRDGAFLGALAAPLQPAALTQAVAQAQQRVPEELP